MKKCIGIILFTLLFSCNDGDLDIETIDFDSIETIQYCDEISTTSSNVLFKINGDEALILELPSGAIQNEATTEDIVIEVNDSGSVIYRIFSDDVTSSYFCDEVPPVSPTVLTEVNAEDGQIYITTVAIDSVTFQHTIALSGISLVTDNDNRITDLSINEFGVITTSL